MATRSAGRPQVAQPKTPASTNSRPSSRAEKKEKAKAEAKRKGDGDKDKGKNKDKEKDEKEAKKKLKYVCLRQLIDRRCSFSFSMFTVRMKLVLHVHCCGRCVLIF